MIRYLFTAAMLVACSSGDKCERAYKKLLAMEKAEGKGGKDDAFTRGAIQKCKDDLKQHPDHGAMLDCIIAVNGTPSAADLDRCTEAAGVGSVSDYKNVRPGDASIHLSQIGTGAKAAFAASGEFPEGKVGLTPANECCYGLGSARLDGKDSGKCPVDPQAWQDPLWKALAFQVDKPSAYRYSYESDGKTFTALAVGDADCDQEMATFTLTGSIENGKPKLDMTAPPKGAY